MLIKVIVTFFTAGSATAVGYGDLQAAAFQPAVMGIASFGFLLGAAYPDGAWRRALMLGLTVPLAQVLSRVTGAQLPYPLPPDLADTFLALVPAFAGTFLGVGLRRVLGPAAKESP